MDRWQKRTEWPLAAVAAIFLALYSVRVLTDPQSSVSINAARALWVVWAAFGIDYVARLSLATDRRRWFFRHLVDLAVVALPVFQPLRMLRLLVLLVALQTVIGKAIRGKVMVYTAFSVTLLVYVASLAVLQVERGQPNAEINSFGDAVWWSISIVTTVGYGDLAPVTVMGRVVAVLLMAGGISLLGAVTATTASWIVQRVEADDTARSTPPTAPRSAIPTNHFPVQCVSRCCTTSRRTICRTGCSARFRESCARARLWSPATVWPAPSSRPTTPTTRPTPLIPHRSASGWRGPVSSASTYAPTPSDGQSSRSRHDFPSHPCIRAGNTGQMIGKHLIRRTWSAR